MEEMLRKLKTQVPPQRLRERVLATAHKEFKQIAEKPDWVDRIWASRVFWYSSAAAVLVCMVTMLISHGNSPSYRMTPPPPDPAAVALAQEIADTLGDGPILEQRLIAQLSGPTLSGHNHEITQTELLRNLQ